MKNTKANVIKVLEKHLENTRALVRLFKERGDKVYEEKMRSEALALQDALWLLTDEEYFNNQYKIFNEAE